MKHIFETNNPALITLLGKYHFHGAIVHHVMEDILKKDAPVIPLKTVRDSNLDYDIVINAIATAFLGTYGHDLVNNEEKGSLPREHLEETIIEIFGKKTEALTDVLRRIRDIKDD